MAVQSLYRRYRPRRFDELKGQEHVVRALRNAVKSHREGQAYLFSGPRGTGKTSTARILAKVLNCEDPQDGEPCGICNSCGAIDSGNSYDVLELDAASNNGVENMRDLIERAALGSPGRHRVFILDEVHMLSKPAEAALLKTLEEPPPHVVFVLATTDPQKVSETIRSRTQHLQFHLLPMAELEEHVRFVVADAALKVSEDAIQHVLAQGGGSARDTLSALELVAAAGGDVEQEVSTDEFIEAIVERDPARAVRAVASAVARGADPRTLTESVVAHLRDCFLSQMAPDLVQLPDRRADAVAEQAARLPLAQVVRSIEVLGEMLVEMRHSPDPRVLLEVAMITLTRESGAAAGDVAALESRVARLESSRDQSGSIPRTPAPVDPKTGRAQLGGRARPAAPTAAVAASAGPLSEDQIVARWSEVLSELKPIARATLSTVKPVECVDGMLVVAAPNEPTAARVAEHVPALAAVLARRIGHPIEVRCEVDARRAATGPSPTPSSAAARTPDPVGAGAAATGDDDTGRISPDDVGEVIPPQNALDDLRRAFPGSEVIDAP
jgi:DNA polymerase-3 subunit gamma/tau